MGGLRYLQDTQNVHILLAQSNLAEIYVYDKLKEKCKGNSETVITVDSNSSVKNMFDLVSVEPFMADKWLFIIDYKKVNKSIFDNISLFTSETSEFLIKTKTYHEYLEVSKKLSFANDMYLYNIRYYDVEYLLRDYKISPKLVEFCARSYYTDPDKVFLLLEELKNEVGVNSRKQIMGICGSSTGSINTFVMTLLTDDKINVKNLHKLYSKRLQAMIEFADYYGYSTLRNFILASLRNLMDVKTLEMAGIIYDRVENLPRGYDETKLHKYQFFVERLKAVPYSRIATLYSFLYIDGVWHNQLDMLTFFYDYYGGEE